MLNMRTEAVKNNCTGFFTCFVFIVSISVQLFVTSLHAQNSNKEKKWTVSAGVGIMHWSFTDETFSKLAYNGVTPGLGGGLRYSRTKYVHVVNMVYTTGKLGNKFNQHEPLRTKFLNAEYNFYRLFPGSAQGTFLYKAGTGIDVVSHKRFYSDYINQNISYELAFSLKAAAEFIWQPDILSRLLTFVNTIHLPVITFCSQPVYGAYAWAVPLREERELKSIVRAAKAVAIPAYLRVKNNFSVRYKPAKKHMLSFCYTIHYARMQKIRTTELMMNQIMLNYELSL